MMDFDLKEVFSILDENNEGRIQLRRFVDVANNYYSDAEQLARIIKALDPKNTGLINFDQFCHGISQISSLQGVSLKDVASDLTRLSRENSLVEDLDQRSLNQDGSTTTFNEYDVESDETSNRNNRKNPTTSLILDTSIFGDEEEFSGVAESNSSDLIYPRVTTPQIIKRINPSEEVEQQLQETVDELQKTVEVLNEQKQNTTDRFAQIQSENINLKTRLLALEDRFHDLEGQQARSTQSEQEKYFDYLNKKDRNFSQEKEILQSRISAIENELKQTQTTNGQMKKDVKQLKDKLEDVDYQLRESQLQCNDLVRDNEKLLEQLRLQREQLEAEKFTNTQLSKQLTTDTSSMFGRTENILKNSEIRILDLDAQVRALKIENEKLKSENEELQLRAVAVGFHEGRRLMVNGDSLEAELELLSKDELLDVNRRLHEYIDSLLLQILSTNPTILEKH